MSRVFWCRKLVRYGLWVTSVTLALRTAFADIAIVDQQNLNNEGLFDTSSIRFSQSFTPSLPSFDVVQVIFANPGNVAITDLELTLFEGNGLGNSLGTSGLFTLPAHSGPTLMEFRILTPGIITVQPGAIYTFSIGTIFPVPFVARYGTDTYAGGNMFDSTYIYPDRDLWFREGLSVPEPTVFAFIITTSLAATALLRKKMPRTRNSLRGS